MTSAHARPSWAVLGVVSLGGALGSLGRWGVGLALPFEAGTGWPWASFLVNITGSFVLGVVTVVILELRPLSRLARPFWGAGVCGGYTTFSTFALEVHHLLGGGRAGVALAYTAASLLCGVGAVASGAAAGRWGGAAMVTAVVVALGGAVGAPLRFLVDGEVRRWLGERWPGGTLIVNVLGALLLGVVTRIVGAGGSGWLQPLVGTGLCGALTTFSTFSYDAWVLLLRRAWFGMVAYVAATLVLGIGGFWVGWLLAG